MRYAIFLVLSLSFLACSNKGSNNAAGNLDLTGFEQTTIKESNALKVVKKDQSAKILEEGFISNGQRNGSWIVYHPDVDRIKSITNYVDGQLNGFHMEFTNRGQIEFKGSYLNNEYNGLVAKYKFGRPLEEYQYKDGKLHGTFNKYTDRGKVQQAGGYKDGKQHGLLQYFDDEGNITLQYEYNDGEKISGGIVEKEESTE